MPAADLLELGRRGRIAELAQQAEQARAAAGWDGAAALELAAAWLLAGDRRQADLAVLEADQLAPYLALVPDTWGLWPAPEPRPQPIQPCWPWPSVCAVGASPIARPSGSSSSPSSRPTGAPSSSRPCWMCC